MPADQLLQRFDLDRSIDARIDDDDVDRSREAGASGYVTKDRIAFELVATIVEVTRRRLP